MPAFEIRSGEEKQVVEASSWMAALGEGLSSFGLDESELAKVIIDINVDGGIRITVPSSGRTFEIREQDQSVKPRLAQALDDAPVRESSFDAPDPRESAAYEVASDRGRDSLDAVLAETAALADTEDTESAGKLALDLAMRWVPAESGAVLLLSPDKQSLVFVAARGPRAASVRGLSIPANAGIAGVSLRSRTALLVREVDEDTRHYADVDKKTGYRTQALIVVPLRGPRGIHGVLELLNPFGMDEFEDWHLEATQVVAAKLAARLG